MAASSNGFRSSPESNFLKSFRGTHFRSMMSTFDRSGFISVPPIPITERQGNDSLQEVSVQLNLLKKKYNRYSLDDHYKGVKVGVLQRDLEHYSGVNQKVSVGISQLLQVAGVLETKISHAKKEQERNLMLQECYLNVVARMDKERIKCRKRMRERQDKIKQVEAVLLENQLKKRVALENLSQVKFMHQLLEKHAANAIEEQRAHVKDLEKEVKKTMEKKKWQERREERAKRILENAVENKDIVSKRQNLLLHRMWHRLLNLKMREKFNKSTENQFNMSRLSLATNNKNIYSIAENYLINKTSLNATLASISNLKHSIQELRNKTDQLNSKIQELEYFAEEHREKPDVEDKARALALDKNKLNDLSVVNHRILEWLRKTFLKLNSVTDSPIEFEEGKVRENVGKIKEVVCRHLKANTTILKDNSNISDIFESIPEDTRNSLRFANTYVFDTDDSTAFMTALITSN